MTTLVLHYLFDRLTAARAHLARARDDGVAIEYVLVVGLVAVLAIAVIAVIAAKVKAKADSIDLGGAL